MATHDPKITPLLWILLSLLVLTLADNLTSQAVEHQNKQHIEQGQ